MTTQTNNRLANDMTIVSKKLLRVKQEEWLQPTRLFTRIDGMALSELLAELNNLPTQSARYNVQRALLMFDRLLRVIDEPPVSSVLHLGTRRFTELQDLFYSALASNKFNALTPSVRITYARAFYTFLRELKQKFSIQISSFVPNSNKFLPDELAQAFDGMELCQSETGQMQPFLLTDKGGETYNVLLGPMAQVLGRDFTIRFHSALNDIARAKAKDTALRDFGTTFAKFIAAQTEAGQLITEAQLQDSKFVRDMVVDFMETHFKKMLSMKGGAKEGTLASLQKTWGRYKNYLETLIKKNVIAKPRFGIPEGKPSLAYVKEVRHQRKSDPSDDESGVTHKLLTPVPLHLSDEATTAVIFRQINQDFTTVQNWLDAHLEGLWQSYERGISLSNSQPYRLPEGEKLIELLNPKKNPEALVEAVRYFKQEYSGYVDTSQIETAAYPGKVARDGVSKVKLAQLLGVPNREDAMAMMAYLTSVDGRFTESALADAKLLDGNGTRINAVNSGDNTLTLSVLKERAGQQGWHDVVLSGRAYVFVQRWLQLTAPLRQYMKDNHVKGWQNLFIYSSNPLSSPTYFIRTSNINSYFRAFAQRNEATLGELTEFVTINRIRAQKGILKFLENFDIKAMATELGNDPETSMRYYLPDAIWDYFAVRWIRIFQNLLIVEATRGTPYMARALRFANATELDEFLKNHALEPLIPQSAKEPDLFDEQEIEDSQESDQQSTPPVKEIMVAASHGIFSTLLSVKDAVEFTLAAGDKVHDKALYWYEFAKRLQAHIESSAYPDRGIKKLMKAASLDASRDNFLKAVRA